MNEGPTYDCGIIGGGVGGLCLAIQLARLGRNVVLFEKRAYPFHKVCGEYVSNESAGFLLRLGLPIDTWDAPQIRSLAITTTEGSLLDARLGLGGFGVSRHLLDASLAGLARAAGVRVLEDTRVNRIAGGNVATNKGDFRCTVLVGAYGKARPVFAGPGTPGTGNQFVAVKYHIKTGRPAHQIELHNFSGGYCGVSRVEDNRHCLCYLTQVTNLARNNNDISRMEQNVLYRNKHLKKLFENAEFIFEQPVTASNITFGERRPADDHLLFLGDAAGCISPLAGNGMSMAAYASFVLCGLVNAHLAGDLSRAELSAQYRRSWKGAFSTRIRRARQLQGLFGHRYLSALALRVLNPLTHVKSRLIASTHGVPF